MIKSKPERELISFDAAESAQLSQVILYVITLGRKGATHQKKRVDMVRWPAVMDSRMNCRCSTKPVLKTLEGGK